MAHDDLRASRFQPTYRVEHPVVLTASGAPVGKTVDVDETLVADQLAGQTVVLIDDDSGGGLEGWMGTIASNAGGAGTSSLTFEETPPAIAAGDRISANKKAQPPQDAAGGISDYFGVFKSNELPMRIKEYFEGYYHGGDLPLPDEFIDIANTYEATLELIVKNAAIIGLAMGKVADEAGSYGAEATTLAAGVDHYPGDTELEVAAIGSFADGDPIEIAAGADGTVEIGVINGAPAGTTIQLTTPLKHFHNAGAAVKEVAHTAGVPTALVTHTLDIAHGVPTWQMEVGIERTRKFSATNDIVMQFLGLISKSLELKSEPGSQPLMATMGVAGLAMRDEITAGTDITALSTKTEIGFDKGVYKPSASKVTIDSTVYGEASGFVAKLERNIETPHTHHNGAKPYMEYGDPWDHYEGNVKLDLSVTIPLKNRNFLDKVKEGATGVEVEYLFTRNSTETLKITFTGVKFPQTKFDIPEEGAIPQSIEGKATSMSIEIKDYIPYYEN